MNRRYIQKIKSPQTPRTDLTPYKGHTGAYRVGLVCAVLLFILTAYLAHSGHYFGWEHTWLKAVNGLPGSWYTAALYISYFGSGWAVVAAVISAFFTRLYRLAWRMSLSALIAAAIRLLTQRYMAYPVPRAAFEGVQTRIHAPALSFPNLSAVLVSVIALTFLPYLPRRWSVVVPLLVLLVAVARLYLGVALPLDIIGGIALGSGIVAVLRVLPQTIRILLRID